MDQLLTGLFVFKFRAMIVWNSINELTSTFPSILRPSADAERFMSRANSNYQKYAC